MSFSTNTNDIHAQISQMINAINEMSDKSPEVVAEGLAEGAELILAEQQALAPSSKLSGMITRGRLKTSKAGRLIISTGYSTQAIQNGAAHGPVLEFGRPGKRSRGGVDVKGRRIGYIAARPHIRTGYDNKIEEAVEVTVERFKEVVKW